MSDVGETYNYIYILIKHEHIKDRIRKIGCTNNISRRKQEYKTGNHFPVSFEGYFKIPSRYNIFEVEKTIHRDLKDFSVFQKDGGMEFFQCKTNTLEMVKNVLLNHNIEAIMVDKDDVVAKGCDTREEERKYTDFEVDILFTKINPYPIIFKEDKHKKLRYYQNEALSIMNNNNFGKLILPTGAGKTVIFMEYLFHKTGLLLIIVPSIILVEQTYKKAIEKGFKNVYKVYSKSKDDIDITRKETESILIITTYQSSSKETNKLLKYDYETIIFDECHRTSLSSINEKEDLGCFQKFLNYKKTIEKFFFTATEKSVYASDLKEDEFISSMSDNDLYGNELFRFPYKEAIEKGFLCDYNIEIIDTEKKHIALLNYLKLQKGYKTLIYCSSTSIAKQIYDYLNFSNIENVFYLDSNEKYYKIKNGSFEIDPISKKKVTILEKFELCDKVSILVLCKMCIVGYDFPPIDNVIHYDITKSSIELFQKNGRALRLYNGKQRTLLSFFVLRDNEKDEESIKKCMSDIIRNDPRLEVEAKRIQLNKNKKNIQRFNILSDGYISDFSISTYNKYVNLICNKKFSYQEVKDLIKNYNIKTKEDYFQKSLEDSNLPKNPEEEFKGYFNWIDYFNLNKEDYYTLKECKKYSTEYLEKNPELKKYYLLKPSKITKELYTMNRKFPPHDLWCEIYQQNKIKDIIHKYVKKSLYNF